LSESSSFKEHSGWDYLTALTAVRPSFHGVAVRGDILADGEVSVASLVTAGKSCFTTSLYRRWQGAPKQPFPFRRNAFDNSRRRLDLRRSHSNTPSTTRDSSSHLLATHLASYPSSSVSTVVLSFSGAANAAGEEATISNLSYTITFPRLNPNTGSPSSVVQSHRFLRRQHGCPQHDFRPYTLDQDPLGNPPFLI
jgi:hypothetical protein